MFTGLIEEIGTVVAVRARDGGTELQIAAPETAKHVSPGESIAVTRKPGPVMWRRHRFQSRSVARARLWTTPLGSGTAQARARSGVRAASG